MIVAITGGIGSGKSFVCERLRNHGINVYDCDAAAKRLMRNDRTLQSNLSEAVGKNVFPDGMLDKVALTGFLLASPENNSIIDSIVHPAVAKDFLSSGCEWVESAILYESGFDMLIHPEHVIAVTAPDEVRLDRICLRDNISKEKAQQWIDRQMSDEEKTRRADFVIVNDGTSDIDEQITKILDTLYNNKE